MLFFTMNYNIILTAQRLIIQRQRISYIEYVVFVGENTEVVRLGTLT